jgi:hypothetical protein
MKAYPLSGKPVRVTDDEYLNCSPVWTPDGKSLLFVCDRGGGRDIYRMSVGPSGEAVGEPERMTTGLDVFTLAFSADGGRLSCSVIAMRQNIWSLPVPREETSRSGKRIMLLVRFDDSPRQQVFLEWSTDGETFYFTLTEFEADVWVMELEDSKKR